MLNEEIIELRKKLDESIKNKRPYDEIYDLSVKLDKLIAKYYYNNINNERTE